MSGYTGNERLQGEERDLERRGMKEAQRDVRWLMSTPQGRRVMWRLLLRTKVFEGIFETSNRFAWLEGRRSVGVDLMSEAQELSPNEYALMVRERMDAAAQAKAIRNTTRDAAQEHDNA